MDCEGCGELLADFFDTTNKAGSEITRAKFIGHNVNNAMPEILTHAFMDAAVAKDDEFTA